MFFAKFWNKDIIIIIIIVIIIIISNGRIFIQRTCKWWTI